MALRPRRLYLFDYSMFQKGLQFSKKAGGAPAWPKTGLQTGRFPLKQQTLRCFGATAGCLADMPCRAIAGAAQGYNKHETCIQNKGFLRQVPFEPLPRLLAYKKARHRRRAFYMRQGLLTAAPRAVQNRPRRPGDSAFLCKARYAPKKNRRLHRYSGGFCGAGDGSRMQSH